MKRFLIFTAITLILVLTGSIWMSKYFASKPIAEQEELLIPGEANEQTLQDSNLDDVAPTTPTVNSEADMSDSASEGVNETVTATRRMIHAHSPLTEEKISNPDSTENQKILQQMIFKSISDKN